MRSVRSDREVPTPAAVEAGRRGGGEVLITGGAGFVGCNLAFRLLRQGKRVRILDNLSRAGVETNLEWLERTHGSAVVPIIEDVRDAVAVRKAVRGVSQVYHLAAQVAVTGSLDDPVDDFEVNARGTLNVLEAIRGCDDPPSLLFTSTNKVYGGLTDIPLVARRGRYEPVHAATRRSGIGEARALDFQSPYGCSKGTADQYVLDYSRSYGLPTIVFRMSCIYGPHQYGTEDQGWVAHFLIRALQEREIVLYGDGMQVRDILFVDDLVDAMLIAQRRVDRLAGEAFNIGGGPANTTSLLELVDLIAEITAIRPALRFENWRVGDQRYYVSDSSRFRSETGWSPGVPVREGVRRLCEWLAENEVSQRPATRESEPLEHPVGLRVAASRTASIPLLLDGAGETMAAADQGAA
jgi:CDP-paratose 2-epimerase